MRAISILFRRELGAYLRSPLGYIVAAVVLMLDGILFMSNALGDDQKRLSALVLEQFFYWSSGPTMIAAVALSMGLIAEERGSGTIVLLHTSPITDAQIVLGKFLSALTFLALLTLATLYMPLLILVHGKISLAHVAVGYLGLLLLGAAVLAMGLFASALTRHQLLAAAIAGALVGTAILLWYLASVADPPFKTFLSHVALWARHYPPFMRGVLHLRDVVYYVAVTWFFLLLAVKTMEAKRWS